DFFTPGPLPGYAGDPNNNNGWIKADVPLLGELGAEVDEPMIDSVIDEEWLIAPVTPSLMRVVPLPSTYEVGGPSTAAEGQSFTLLTHGFPVPSLVIKDLSTHMGCLVGKTTGYDVLDGSSRGYTRAGQYSGGAERCTNSAAADYGFWDEQS
nr:hypothetical protein [Tanacetum cinerariifolium]